MDSIQIWHAYLNSIYFTPYNFAACYARISYIILASKYIQIRQRTLLEAFQRLNQKLCCCRRIRSRQLSPYWSRYMSLNTHLDVTSRTIREYSRFCAPILSVILPYYITLQCYMLYINLFVKHISIAFKYAFCLGMLEVNGFLFLVMYYCSGVAKFNRKFEKLTRQFVFYIRRHGGFKKNNLSAMLKVKC